MDREHWRPVLRDANFADVPEMARLDLVCFPQHAFPAQLFMRFLELELPCVVADAGDGGLAGLAMVMPEPDERSCLLVTLDVDPGVRHRGLGRRLVAWCARTMVDAYPETRLMWLTVARLNEGARVFYDRLGFRSIDEIGGYYGEDDAVIMVHLDIDALAGPGEGSGGPSEI